MKKIIQETLKIFIKTLFRPRNITKFILIAGAASVLNHWTRLPFVMAQTIKSTVGFAMEKSGENIL